MQVTVSAPGKLVVAGEWAILDIGNPGIIASVDRRVFAEVRDSKNIEVSIKDFGIKELTASFDGSTLTWSRELNEQNRKDTQFMKASIETALRYLGSYKPFAIRTWGEETNIKVDGVLKKVGFGSSAASVVAVIGGLLKFNGMDISTRESKDIIYKLATMAHFFAQGKVGSAFDVAASTYGGIFVYKRFDPKWLEQKMSSGAGVKEVAEQAWPSFEVEPLEPPRGFRLLIGWTKESASTTNLVKQVDEWAKLSESNAAIKRRIYASIASLVKELIVAWKEADRERITDLLNDNEELLRELGQKAGVPIETPELRLLHEAAKAAGCAGKLSGAGGGDCGIGICFEESEAKSIRKAWEEKGLKPLSATVDSDGVKAARS
jgi:phosphomevalonate kinase